MAISALDPNTALIVIDMQKGIVGLPCVHPVVEVVSNLSRLLQCFRAQQRPVVLVKIGGFAPGRTERPRAAGERPLDWADLIPELNQQPEDCIITKKTWGAFSSTELHAHLQALGITQVVLAGIATSIGVESSARAAFELGYNVTLAVDAMTDMNLDAHENSVQRIFPRLGETGRVDDIVQLLAV